MPIPIHRYNVWPGVACTTRSNTTYPPPIPSPPLSSLGLVWYKSICRDRRVLSRPIPESPSIPDSPFGNGVLGRINPRPSLVNPVPDPFLTWIESTTCTSRIIPVPSRPRRNPTQIARKRLAASDGGQQSGAAARTTGGTGEAEHLAGTHKD